MPDEPNLVQLALLALSIALLGCGLGLSVLRARGHEKLRLPAKMCDYWGILLALTVLIWHAVPRGRWLPLDSNFATLITLALLLAIFMMYVQKRRPIPGLDWFVVPIVMLLLLAAGIFGRTNPHQYLPTAWSVIHRITTYGGALAFAVAGAAGAMYLVANRQLRMKTALPGPKFGSLERIEHITFHAVTLGFALLTVGAISGWIWVAADHRSVSAGKVVLTVLVWLVYAIVLHTPINPSFRGRKVAMLSIVGFVLMIITVIAVQLMPANG